MQWQVSKWALKKKYILNKALKQKTSLGDLLYVLIRLCLLPGKALCRKEVIQKNPQLNFRNNRTTQVLTHNNNEHAFKSRHGPQ